MISLRKLFSTTEGKILTKKQNDLFKTYCDLPKNDQQRKKIEFDMQVLSDRINSLKMTDTKNRGKEKITEKHTKDHRSNGMTNKNSKETTEQRKSFKRKISGSILFVIGIYIFVYFLSGFEKESWYFFDQEERIGMASGTMLISTGLILMLWDKINNLGNKKE
jgi:hypothetical protein